MFRAPGLKSGLRLRECSRGCVQSQTKHPAQMSSGIVETVWPPEPRQQTQAGASRRVTQNGRSPSIVALPRNRPSRGPTSWARSATSQSRMIRRRVLLMCGESCLGRQKFVTGEAEECAKPGLRPPSGAAVGGDHGLRGKHECIDLMAHDGDQNRSHDDGQTDP